MRRRSACPLVFLVLFACNPASDSTETAKVAPAPQAPSPKPEAEPSKVADNSASNLPAGHPPIAGNTPGQASNVTPSGEVRSETIGTLTAAIPTEWTRNQPRSAMRLAEFSLPGPGGEASLAVFRFPGGGGGTQANIDRWVGQFEGDGDKKPEPTVTTKELGPIKVTTVDITGRFPGSTMPGAPPARSIDDARMFGLVVEGDGDPYYFKVVGAKATLDVWADAWSKTVDSLAAGGASGDAVAAGAKPSAPAKP